MRTVLGGLRQRVRRACKRTMPAFSVGTSFLMACTSFSRVDPCSSRRSSLCADGYGWGTPFDRMGFGGRGKGMRQGRKKIG